MRQTLLGAALVTSLLMLGACSSRYSTTEPMTTGAWARQSAGWGPTHQGMLDLSSLALDAGATVMYDGGDTASPLFAVEFGAGPSFWRVEEFEPAQRSDLRHVQALIDDLHNTSLCIVSCEIDRRIAEAKADERLDELTGLAHEVWRHECDDAWDSDRVGKLGALLHKRHEDAEASAEGIREHLREAYAHADEIEAELTRILSGSNVIVLRWNTGSEDEAGYAVLSGLRRVRLVLGRDFADEPAFPSIDERERLGWSTNTGLVTTALQAREIVYISRHDLGASVGSLLEASAGPLSRTLDDAGVIGVNSAIAGEHQRMSALVSRGRLSEPRRYAVNMHWARFLSGELPPAFSADSMGDDGRWVTFAVATTQLRTLKKLGRLD